MHNPEYQWAVGLKDAPTGGSRWAVDSGHGCMSQSPVFCSLLPAPRQPSHPTLLTQGLHPKVAGLREQSPPDDDLLGRVERIPHDQRDA